jgi:hypothetical protein
VNIQNSTATFSAQRALLVTGSATITGMKQPLVAAGLIGALAAYLVATGMSFNFWFFAMALTGLIVALSANLRTGALFGLIYYCIKPAYSRLAYHLDATFGAHPAVDVLRFSAGVFLAVICLLIIIKHIHERRNLISSKLDMVMMLFIGLNFLSIFNPHNSVFNGLAGFERNIFPTVFLFFVGREVIRTREDLIVMCKAFGAVALVTVMFGLKHATSGIFGFETSFFNDYFARTGFDGWLTIGVNGIEFRNFSTFFSYMEFTFTLALWSIMLLGVRASFISRRWNRFKWLFGILTFALLALTIERTPIMMVIVGLLGTWYILSERKRRRQIVLYAGALLASIIIITSFFQHQLELTGVAKLQRLAEMADPSQASSIEDRMDRMWKPTLAIIAANPMGVGVGYGSETIARGSAGGFHVQPHNEFLQKALETGLLGAGLFALALWIIFFKLKRLSQSANDKFIKSATAVGCGILLAFVLCAQINLPFSGAQGCFFWFVSGALLSVGENEHSLKRVVK